MDTIQGSIGELSSKVDKNAELQRYHTENFFKKVNDTHQEQLKVGHSQVEPLQRFINQIPTTNSKKKWWNVEVADYPSRPHGYRGKPKDFEVGA